LPGRPKRVSLPDMQPELSELDHWLASHAGAAFREAESQAVKTELGRFFGAHFLQVGRWGPPDAFLGLPAMARRAMCDCEPGPGVDFVAQPERLPIPKRCIDGLLLAHTIERSRYPHEVLREAERVLRGGGRLMLLGFNPVSALGLRRLLTGGNYPPGLEQFVSVRRLRDWLSLLGFDVTVADRYYAAFPAGNDLGQRLRRLPLSWGAYVLVAVKRVYNVRPLRSRWRAPAKVASGLVEPSTRNPA
jgi:SAM-dependent methyltransferase